MLAELNRYCSYYTCQDQPCRTTIGNGIFGFSSNSFYHSGNGDGGRMSQWAIETTCEMDQYLEYKKDMK